LKPYAVAIPSSTVDLPVPFSPTRKVTDVSNAKESSVLMAGILRRYESSGIAVQSTLTLRMNRSVVLSIFTDVPFLIRIPASAVGYHAHRKNLVLHCNSIESTEVGQDASPPTASVKARIH
jgi:hypothetical protein